MIYLDNAATSIPCNNARMQYQESFGNASSIYNFGLSAHDKIEEVRRYIALYLGVYSKEIYFTSGGTESNNWAINIASSPRTKMITTAIEHPSVLNPIKNKCREYGIEPSIIGVDKDGTILENDLKDELLKACKDDNIDTIFLSIMMVNNEIGVKQDINGLFFDAKLLGYKHHKRVITHTDAVQAVGHSQFISTGCIDMLSASAHKFHGYPGCGFLYINSRLDDLVKPFMYGGHQEGGLRGGTYNSYGILAMQKGLQYSKVESDTESVIYTHDRFVSKLKDIKGVHFNTCEMVSVPYIINCRFDGVRGEELQAYLNEKEIYVSTGSACTSDSNAPSHVLTAIGLNEKEANESIRISFDGSITNSNIDTTIFFIKEAISLLGGKC